jgi:hypothetical protein
MLIKLTLALGVNEFCLTRFIKCRFVKTRVSRDASREIDLRRADRRRHVNMRIARREISTSKLDVRIATR